MERTKCPRFFFRIIFRFINPPLQPSVKVVRTFYESKEKVWRCRNSLSWSCSAVIQASPCLPKEVRSGGKAVTCQIFHWLHRADLPCKPLPLSGSPCRIDTELYRRECNKVACRCSYTRSKSCDWPSAYTPPPCRTNTSHRLSESHRLLKFRQGITDSRSILSWMYCIPIFKTVVGRCRNWNILVTNL